jgi:hypothetical protein
MAGRIEDEMNELPPDLKGISPYMPQGQADPRATLHYDLFADALVWSDELPKHDENGRLVLCWCLRTVWRYRTSLVLGVPDERCRADWEEAMRLFPKWPGFAPSRRQSELAAVYAAFHDAAMRSMEQL